MYAPSRVMVVSALLATVMAQNFPFPDGSGEVKCDALIRPDYAECDKLSEQFFGTTIAGPGFNEGTVVTGANCRLRMAKCGLNTDGAFEVEGASNMYQIMKNRCGSRPAGGVYRSGDACLVVETEDNPLKKRTANPVREQREERRSLVAEARAQAEAADLDRRQCSPPPGPCYTYTEQEFIANVRGVAERVCDNVLPNGGRCDTSKSVTTSQSISTSFEVSTGLEGVIEASASFTFETSKSKTETLTTAITVDCPNGGYVVWYPLMDESSGECGRGPQAACNGGCITDTRDFCTTRRPVATGQGRLTGEYDVQCL